MDIKAVIGEEISKFNKTVFTDVPDEIFQQLRQRKFNDEANRSHMKVFKAKNGKDYLVIKTINQDVFNVYRLDNLRFPIATAVFDVGADSFSGYEHNQSIKVAPEFQRQGVATAITDMAENIYKLPYKPTKLLSEPMQGFVDNRFNSELNERRDIEKIQTINVIIKEIQRLLDNGKYIEVPVELSGKVVNYIVTRYDDLYVYLIPMRSSIEGAFHDKDWKEFKAPFVMISNARVRGNKISFDANNMAHELQHYLDYKEGIPTVYNGQDILKPEGGIKQSYYINPNEWSAHITQLLRQYFQVVNIKKLPADFKSFYKDFFRRTDAKRYYRELDAQYKQRFIKRLYQFHQKLLERKQVSEEYVPRPTQNIYNINDLAGLMQRMGYDKEGAGHLAEMLLDAYRSGGDQGVVDTYAEMTGTVIYPISNGRYVFGSEPTGGGEPMLEEQQQKSPQEIADNLVPSEYWERMERNNPKYYQEQKPMLANVDVKLADEAFKNDHDFYISPDDRGIGNRKERVMQTIEDGTLKYAPDVSIRMSHYGVPVLSFGDGRHRFAVLRDLGVKTINMTFSKESQPYIHLLQR